MWIFLLLPLVWLEIHLRRAKCLLRTYYIERTKKKTHERSQISGWVCLSIEFYTIFALALVWNSFNCFIFILFFCVLEEFVKTCLSKTCHTTLLAVCVCAIARRHWMKRSVSVGFYAFFVDLIYWRFQLLIEHIIWMVWSLHPLSLQPPSSFLYSLFNLELTFAGIKGVKLGQLFEGILAQKHT